MGPSVAQGYAGTTTDAGVNIYIDAATLTSTTTSWSLRSPGNVDLVALQNFASRAFDDLPKIAKAVTAQYYGKPAHHSYFQGCSGGGRQAMMSVQRYPDNYDGILAGSPAINYATFIPTAMYTQLTMNRLGYYPATCEFRAITAAAVKACDLLDDIEDNIISAPALCNFDAMSAVGEEYDCNGEKRIISKEAAQISNAAWTGPFKNGTRVWFGKSPQTENKFCQADLLPYL
jgi:feruloyl esterase